MFADCLAVWDNDIARRLQLPTHTQIKNEMQLFVLYKTEKKQRYSSHAIHLAIILNCGVFMLPVQVVE